MVRADPEEAEGEYKWLAVLTWKGIKPDPEEVNEISKKVENYRAKILMFDEWLEGRGFTSGILQVQLRFERHLVCSQIVSKHVS